MRPRSQDRIVPDVELELYSSAEPTVMLIAEIVIGPRLDYDEATTSLTTFTSSLGDGISTAFRRSTACGTDSRQCYSERRCVRKPVVACGSQWSERRSDRLRSDIEGKPLLDGKLPSD